VEYEQFILVFTSIIWEALPFVVLGVVIAGILEEFVPQQFMSGVFQGRLPEKQQKTLLGTVLGPAVSLLRFRLVAILMGGLLGLVFPMCECGIIAIMRRLIRKGVPLSVCITYMLAGPIINVVVLLSTYVAFNPPQPGDYVLGGPLMVVLLRAGSAFLIACVTGLIVEAQFRRQGAKLVLPSLVVPEEANGEPDNGERKPLFRRLGNISETALHDFVDIMAFLILGAALAAFGRAALIESEAEQFIQSSPAVAILLMMGIAVLFSLCSEADAFVAANFPAAWPPAAKLAFLVLGPMMDIKLYIMYTRIFRHRLIWTIILSVAFQVFLYMLILHFVFPDHGYSETYLKLQQTQTSP
jgi:uncharacterized membrane protein YraQ (UPF0718 family)